MATAIKRTTSIVPTDIEIKQLFNYSKITNTADYTIVAVDEAKTVFFWFYLNALGVSNAFVSHYENGSNLWIIQKTASNVLQLFFAGGGGGINITGDSTPATEWRAGAFVVVGADVGLYLDDGLGVMQQVAYDGSRTPDTFSGSLYIGQDRSSSAYLAGRMQDLFIAYNNPFNASPNSGSTDSFTVPSSPLSLIF